MTNTKHCAAAFLATTLCVPGLLIAGPWPQTAVPQATVITRVKIDRIGEQIVLSIAGSGRLTYHKETLKNPERLVLDFDGGRFALAQPIAASALGPVRGVRVGQFNPDVARVVIDLDTVVPYSIKSEAQSVTVLFGSAVSAPASGASASAIPSQPEIVASHAPSLKAAAVKPAPPIAPSISKTGPFTPPIQQAGKQAATGQIATGQFATAQIIGVEVPPGQVPTRQSPSAAQHELQQNPPDSIENGMLTLHAQNRPLRLILQRIGDEAKVAIIIAEGLGNEQITVDFQHFRLDEALRQILKDYDALFLYGADNGTGRPATLQTVWVYPAKQAEVISHK